MSGFNKQPVTISDSTRFAAAVTPHDTNELAHPGKLYVGGAGNLQVVTLGGDEIPMVGVSGFVPVVVKHVKATGTTATDILVFW